MSTIITQNKCQLTMSHYLKKKMRQNIHSSSPAGAVIKTGAPGVVYCVSFPSGSTAPTAMVNLEFTMPSKLPLLDHRKKQCEIVRYVVTIGHHEENSVTR